MSQLIQGIPNGAAACILAMALAGCSGTPPEHRRNLILIVVDTLRGDYLSIYGGPTPTPNLDRLAQMGVRFTRAYSHSPVTGPSHASLFTGLTPFEHGVTINTQVLPNKHTTLAEVLNHHGYGTTAFVSLGVLKSRFGFHQGFDSFDESFDKNFFRRADEITDLVLRWLQEPSEAPFFLWIHYSDPHEPYAPPGVVFPTVEIWMNERYVATVEANGSRNKLEIELQPGENTLLLSYPRGGSSWDKPMVIRGLRLWDDGLSIELGEGWLRTNGPSTHDASQSLEAARLPARLKITNQQQQPVRTQLSFWCHERLTSTRLRELYAGETAYVDRQIGRVIEVLQQKQLLQESVLIFTSDHGEGLGDHDLSGHIQQLYDSLIRIPLFLVAPGLVPEGHVLDQPVRHIDLLPTVLELLGLETRSAFSGVSLVKAMTGEAPTGTNLPVVSATFRPLARFDRRALILEPYKFILTLPSGEEELYNLRQDPRELINLITSEPNVADHLRLALQQEATEFPQSPPTATNRPALTEEERDKLRALGYVN